MDGTERCENCDEPSKGVTMWEGMEGWSCPNCGHYNEFDQSQDTGTDREEGSQ